MSAYRMHERKSRIPRRIKWLAVALVIIVIAAIFFARHFYVTNLQPVSATGKAQVVTVQPNSTVSDIAKLLKEDGLIRDSHTFELYVAVHDERDSLQAGTYKFSPSQSVPQIVGALVNGRVATDLVTILPGKRIDQVRSAFVKAGFEPAAVDAALNASQYRATYPALADNPSGASLEGFLYPDSYQKTANTDPKIIVEEALTEMQKHLTSDVRSGFAKEGLTVYQGVTLASIVGQEASTPPDRAQVAQVFLKRLKVGMPLGSDVTAIYGAIHENLGQLSQGEMLTYDSPYNTHLHKGLPPGPIGNTDDSMLRAASHPANTDWLYFVTGKDCKTHFGKTLEDHNNNISRYGNGCEQQQG